MCLNYNGNRIVSANLIAGNAQGKTLRRVCISLLHRAESRAGCGNHHSLGSHRFVNLRKSFRRSAKPTRLRILRMHVGNALRLATDMLLLRADEVARNGAFGKILRPEVFLNAPLH